MQIVITMAGLGSRFKNAGYTLPKYMIEVNKKTLFEWSLLSLNSFKDAYYYFIVRKDDGAKDFISSKCATLEIHNFKVIELSSTTSGQAETVMMAKKYLNTDDELLIYNIDTYVEPNELNPNDLKGDGFIPCFKGKGDHWSFVKTDNNNKAINVVEKIRVSENCTVGAYYFKSVQLYSNLYTEYYQSTESKTYKEQYVAPIYNQLIQNGGDVFISMIPETKVHVLGTPEEVEEFKSHT